MPKPDQQQQQQAIQGKTDEEERTQGQKDGLAKHAEYLAEGGGSYPDGLEWVRRGILLAAALALLWPRRCKK